MFSVLIMTVLCTTGMKQLGLRLPLDEQVLEWAEDSFQQGINARGTPGESKFFQSAADHYDELRRRGFDNATLLRNQGNALLLAGDLPRAILAYRRGLRLNSNDRQIRINLAYAREQVAYSSADSFARPPGGWWPPWLPRLTAGSSFWIFLVSYTLTWVGLAWSWTGPADNRRSLVWAGLAGSIFFAACFAIQIHGDRADRQHPLVVIAEDKTSLLKGNNALYPRAYETPLNRGVEARLLQARGSWLQIELTGGQIGWVPRENALLDIP